LDVSPQGGTHEIDVFSQLLTDLRPSNSLKAAENFIQYIFGGNVVGLFGESAGTGLAYHWAKSLMVILLGTGQFSRRYSEAGMPYPDWKLRGPVSVPGGKMAGGAATSRPSM
jgi:hypothetical protein